MEMKAPAPRRAGGGFPLQWKVSLLTLGALIALALATGIGNSLYFRKVLARQAATRGRAIANTLAAALVDMPESAVGTTLASVKKEAGLAYLAVVSVDGKVVAHTFEGAPAPALTLRKDLLAQELVIDGKAYLDVPAAVITGDLVHVGLDPAEDARTLLEAQKLLAASTLLALLLAALLSFWLVGRFVRPLQRLTWAATRIVKGDLSQPVEVVSNDEVGALAAAFIQMVQSLKEVLVALQESVQHLGEASRALEESTSEQGQTITRQATALQEMQVTAQEIRQTSVLAAEKAEAVLQQAERADEVSVSGGAAIERSLLGLTDIRAQVGEIAEKIAQLAGRTQQVSGITQSVKDLADQSNMLALNAAIEAVRSGEHGKGFAVVAREIRSLADQSIEATGRVREILEDIGSAIRSTVAITERGAQKIEGGLSQVRQSGENLRALSGIVKDNSAAVRQIAAAVSQQNVGIKQIFSAVTDQNRMMDETLRRIETTTRAAVVLRQLSLRVSDVIKRFRV